MTDVDLTPGVRFTEEIRQRISYAHVFISILTSNSKLRPWVHQEIGYAMGMRVPILPLALDELPQGMAEEIHAVKVAADLSDLPNQLRPKTLDDVVTASQKGGTATFECAEHLSERTRQLVEYSERVFAQTDNQGGRLRQRSAFSSFSLPRRSVQHSDWDAREGEDQTQRGPEVRELLLKERDVMERHARLQGCDLILDPYVSVRKPNRGAASICLKHEAEPTVVRLRTLQQFLESMPDDKVRVALQKGKIEGSSIIIGDWFVAEAVVPHYKGGYRQTHFTRHACTVLSRVQAFDREMEDVLSDSLPPSGTSSRVAAIETIQGIIHEIQGG